MKNRNLVLLIVLALSLIVSCAKQITDTAPSVTSTVPSVDAKDVLVNSNITVNFDESVSFDAASFTLKCGSESQPFKLTSTSPDTTVVIDPDSALPAGECTLTTVASKISDVDKIDPPDTLESDHKLSFITESDTAPSIVSTSPSNGTTDVDVNDNLIVTFSEAVTFSESSFELQCGTNPQPFKLESTSPDKTITINPESTLPAGECTLSIVANQISDSDVIDPPDTLESDFKLVFSTETDTAPSIIGTVPVEGAAAIAVNDNIEIIFSEVVNYSKSSVDLKCDAEDIDFVLASTSPSKTLEINPKDDALTGTCTVKILSASVSDVDNVDPPDTLLTDFELSFTTQNFFVSMIGSGQGTIFSIGTDNIACGSQCSANVASGSTIKLQAEANTATSYFASWQGVSCKEGQESKTCSFVTSGSSTQVSALFQPRLELKVELVDDNGIANVSGNLFDENQYYSLGEIIMCGEGYEPAQDCIELLVPGDVVHLNISNTFPKDGKVFDSWSGVSCEYGQTSSYCNFTMAADTTVSVNFVDTHTLTVTKPVGGTISNFGYGNLSCGNSSGYDWDNCTIEAGPRQEVSLYAESIIGTGVATWGNALCSDSDRNYCELKLSEDVVLAPVFPEISKLEIKFTDPSLNARIQGNDYRDCSHYHFECEWHFESGTVVVLDAKPDYYSSEPQREFFKSWSGVTCDEGSQTGSKCSFMLTDDLSISANYEETVVLNLSISSNFAYASNISDNYGQRCDVYDFCNFIYNLDEDVVLTTNLSSGEVFESWGTLITCDEGSQTGATCSFKTPANATTISIDPSFK